MGHQPNQVPQQLPRSGANFYCSSNAIYNNDRNINQAQAFQPTVTSHQPANNIFSTTTVQQQNDPGYQHMTVLQESSPEPSAPPAPPTPPRSPTPTAPAAPAAPAATAAPSVI